MLVRDVPDSGSPKLHRVGRGGRPTWRGSARLVREDRWCRPWFLVRSHQGEWTKKYIDNQQTTRQQTTTVDYKRLFNGFLLTRFASLQGETKPNRVWRTKNPSTKKTRPRFLSGILSNLSTKSVTTNSPSLIMGLNYYYVEEIRTGKKSLAFQTLYKRTIKNPSDEGL